MTVIITILKGLAIMIGITSVLWCMGFIDGIIGWDEIFGALILMAISLSACWLLGTHLWPG